VSTDAETNICAGVKKGFEVACSEFWLPLLSSLSLWI
jgi:hypothetical protein